MKEYVILTDIQNNKTYKTVVIGTQTWMAENLNYKTSDGSSRCYPISGYTNTNDNDNTNCDKYGRLYDWSTAEKVCPAGWHLPSDAEWTALTDYVGGSSTAGTKLKAKSGWNRNNGTDDYGFSALPGGYGLFSGDEFDGDGISGDWWSATEDDDNGAYFWDMSDTGRNVSRYSNDKKVFLFSVRCVKDYNSTKEY